MGHGMGHGMGLSIGLGKTSLSLGMGPAWDGIRYNGI